MKCDRCDNEATVHEVMVRGGKRAERHLCESCARNEGVAPAAPPHIPLTQLLNQFITSQLQAGQASGAAHGRSAQPVPAGVCPACGMNIARFRQTGLLGCPDCYAAFEGQLAPLLQRAHEGASHHEGKRPRRIGPAVQPSSPAATVSGPAPGKPSPASPPDATSPGSPPAPSVRSRAKPAAPAKGGAAAGSGAGGGGTMAARLEQLRRQLADAIAKEKYEHAARLRDEIASLEGSGPMPAPKQVARRQSRPGQPPSGGEGGAAPSSSDPESER